MPHDFNKYPELRNREIEEMQFQSPHKQITEDFFATVVKVHDGDTVTLRVSFRDFDFPLRLFGIDAPELNEGGEEARDWLKAMILNQIVLVLIDRKNRVDKYGRLLGKIFYGGRDIGEEEMMLGLAVPFSRRGEGEIPNINKELAIEKWVKA